jgi:hypothetical protein
MMKISPRAPCVIGRASVLTTGVVVVDSPMVGRGGRRAIGGTPYAVTRGYLNLGWHAGCARRHRNLPDTVAQRGSIPGKRDCGSRLRPSPVIDGLGGTRGRSIRDVIARASRSPER